MYISACASIARAVSITLHRSHVLAGTGFLRLLSKRFVANNITPTQNIPLQRNYRKSRPCVVYCKLERALIIDFARFY